VPSAPNTPLLCDHIMVAHRQAMDAPHEQEAHVHLGATVQGKETISPELWEWNEKCCSIWHNCFENYTSDGHTDNLPNGPTQCQNNKHLMKAFGCKPNRCSDHGKTVKTFIRTKDWKKKLKLKFNRRRHCFIRMITIGRPGVKLHQADDIEEIISSYRNSMIIEFHKFRKRSIWKNSVDGGMWFFEATINLQDNGMVKINPHLHIVLLCSKMLPVKDMNDYLAGTNKINLGKIHVSVPRWPNGQIKICKPTDAINYCINYMKTDQQIDGRNRGTFGSMYN
jgi:hypothetical protein